MSARVQEFFFGALQGRQVNKYIITGPDGLQVSVCNYGATLLSLLVPDRYGKPGNVVLGFSTFDALLQNGPAYPGGVCGRYANRIAYGRFSIDGITYHVTQNEGSHCLHGGTTGFDKVIWEAEILPENNGVAFTYLSKEGEEGFPGALQVTVTYRLQSGGVAVEFRAVTTSPTPVNLTLHPYFNLSAGAEPTIATHELQLHAQAVLETDAARIPTGKVISVADSHFDFLQSRNLGAAIAATGGYDACWVVDAAPHALAELAVLRHAPSGRVLRVSSTLPGVQLYTGQYLNIAATDSNPHYGPFAGLCIEPQFFPDGPNHPTFPTTILRPGEMYLHQIHYHFSTQ